MQSSCDPCLSAHAIYNFDMQRVHSRKNTCTEILHVCGHNSSGNRSMICYHSTKFRYNVWENMIKNNWITVMVGLRTNGSARDQRDKLYKWKNWIHFSFYAEIRNVISLFVISKLIRHTCFWQREKMQKISFLAFFFLSFSLDCFHCIWLQR